MKFEMQPYRGKGEVVNVRFYLSSKNKVNLRMLGVCIQNRVTSQEFNSIVILAILVNSKIKSRFRNFQWSNLSRHLF